MSWWGETIERENPEPRYGPDPLTPERLAEIKAYLADVGPNDRNDPEAFVVLSYIEDLLAEVARLAPKAEAYDAIVSLGAPGTKDL